jgi:hypothetical protein
LAAAVPTILPVAFCFVFAFWELRAAEKFNEWEMRERNARPSDRLVDNDLLLGPAAGQEAALLSSRLSEHQTRLSQLRSDMVSKDYSHQASLHRTIASVFTWVGMLGGVLLSAVFGMRRDLRECRGRIRRLEEELAKRESHPPIDWCSGVSLERRLKRATPQPIHPEGGL